MWPRVDAPCQERWEEMPGDDTTRFCARCQKPVHDLSAMSRAEAEVVEAGRCVRFTQRSDGSLVTLLVALAITGAAHADTSVRPPAKKTHLRVLPSPPLGELVEHVPSAPPNSGERTTMGELSVSGARPLLGALKACYERALKNIRPDLAGRMTLKVTILAGRVESAELTDSTIDDPELRRCIVDAALAWRFPEATASFTLSYPLVFVPK